MSDIKYPVTGTFNGIHFRATARKLTLNGTTYPLTGINTIADLHKAVSKIIGNTTVTSLSNCPHPIDSISLARVETRINCKGEPFEKKVYYCEQCGAEFSL